MQLAAFVRLTIDGGGVAPAIVRRFETSLLEAWATADERKLTDVLIDPEVDLEVWQQVFRFWRRATGV